MPMSHALAEVNNQRFPRFNPIRWEPTNTKLFPQTTEIIQKSKAPSLEVFFARQPAGTGIKPHTDNSNFIMTGHLALVVPEGNCWIKVSKQGNSSSLLQMTCPWAGHGPGCIYIAFM